MKNLMLFLALLFSLSAVSQKILLKGTVTDTTNGKSKILINLKYDKFRYPRMNPDGTFEILASPDDSITFSSFRHIPKVFLVSDLAKLNPIIVKLEPGGCEEYEDVPCKENPKLYVFVGKQISFNPYVPQPNYCDVILMDSKFAAKYEILENIYGNFPNKEIEFVGYEHGGKANPFYKHKYVLLYVADYCGTLVHVKYQYDPLFKTKDGKWASPYDYYNYRRLDKNSHIKPQKLEFKKKLKYKIYETADKDKIHPTEYYEIRNGIAIAKYGNYPNELFEIKKLTVLKEFGIFVD